MIKLPPLDEHLGEWIQTISWAATALAAIIGLLNYLHSLRVVRLQRKKDSELRLRELADKEKQVQQRWHALRWKQARVALKLSDRLETNRDIKNAIRTLEGGRVTIESGSQIHTITIEHVLEAMNPTAKPTTSEACDLASQYMVALFHYLNVLHACVRSEVVRFEDLRVHLLRTVHLLRANRPLVVSYLKTHHFHEAILFLEMFDAWKEE